MQNLPRLGLNLCVPYIGSWICYYPEHRGLSLVPYHSLKIIHGLKNVLDDRFSFLKIFDQTSKLYVLLLFIASVQVKGDLGNFCQLKEDWIFWELSSGASIWFFLGLLGWRVSVSILQKQQWHAANGEVGAPKKQCCLCLHFWQRELSLECIVMLLFWGNLAKEKIVSWTSVPSDMVHCTLVYSDSHQNVWDVDLWLVHKPHLEHILGLLGISLVFFLCNFKLWCLNLILWSSEDSLSYGLFFL